ncbi:MAG: DUF3368 domain-containing protein [Armatimonadetes bacterium]|nr:DUF3368 domain-containing protein [Armatimonadota bacterium]
MPWVTVEAPPNRALVLALEMVVDSGEAEAIALAHEHSWRVILDDRRARAVAKRLGTPVIGTVGILLRAKQSGVVPSIRPLLEALEANEFHIGKGLREEALRLAGE